MNTELDWQKLDIIRLFLLNQEEEFSNHIEEFGYESSRSRTTARGDTPDPVDKMEEVL
jgi:hypothetical protein